MNKLYLFILFMLILISLSSVTNEEFGDGLLYGWGRYYPDNATFFNQALIQRDQDGTRAAYSSSLGDDKDAYRMMELSDLSNRISHLPIWAAKRKLMVSCDGCNGDDYGGNNGNNDNNGNNGNNCSNKNNITGKMKDQCVAPCKFDLQKYGSIFEELNRPKPLYTTSLLANELSLR